MEAMAGKNSQASEAVLRADGLTKAFGKTPALSGVNLEIFKGDLVGLVGPDGAGKTTLMRIFAGLMSPDQGHASVMGQNPMGNKSSVRAAMGYMPQAYSLYGDLSVDENLLFFSRMFGIPKAQYAKRRQRLLEITHLHQFTQRRASVLSGGMYKKLALACALLHRPEVLLLDEPTNGVDPLSRRELWGLLGEFIDEGMAVLISTAYMDEAARCSKVNLMHQGQIISQGNPVQLLKEFTRQVFVVQGCTRQQAEPILESTPGVIAFSPAGSRIRVTIDNEFRQTVESAFARIDSTLVPTHPDFEDLFLSVLSEKKDSGE